MIIRVLLACSLVTGFHLPGGTPVDYATGDPVPLLVNAVTPALGTGTLNSFISYDAYDPSFSFCRPKDPLQKQTETLGSVLFGDRLYNSPFDIHMLRNQSCTPLCTVDVFPDSATFLSERIKDSYALNYLIDGLPVAERRETDTGELFYTMGFPLGAATETQHEGAESSWRVELNNHYDIFLEYHSRDAIHHRVVGAVIYPRSIDSLQPGSATPSCSASAPYLLVPGSSNRVAYTYSVMWLPSSTLHASRWDAYLRVLNPNIHLFSIINSLAIALFLSSLIAVILLRSVRSDINKYNALDLGEDVQDDSSWKLLHGEVFRPCRKRNLLAALVGSGAQLAGMVVVTLGFAVLGFLSPANRGAFSNVLIVSWLLFASLAGYVSARLYASLKGDEWTKNLLYTSLLFPSFLFTSISLLNFFLIGAGASGAIPFGTIVVVVLLYFGIAVPLALAGAWAGAEKGPVSHPNRVNSIPRQIPLAPWYSQPLPTAILAGLLPFSAAFIESYYILQSLVGQRAYFAFGFLGLSAGIVGVTTGTVSVLFCYFALCGEEYRWHWRAFLTGGGSSFWIVAYGLLYWATRLHLDSFVNKMLYLGYLLLVAAISFVVTGSIGFLSVYVFLRVIYSRIRVD